MSQESTERVNQVTSHMFPINSLEGAKSVHRSALRQMNEQGIEALMESSDYLEAELKRAYWALVGKVGKHRCDEIVTDLAGLKF